jgi:hypothetical protein
MINLERLEQLQSVSVSEWVSRRKKEGKKNQKQKQEQIHHRPTSSTSQETRLLITMHRLPLALPATSFPTVPVHALVSVVDSRIPAPVARKVRMRQSAGVISNSPLLHTRALLHVGFGLAPLLLLAVVLHVRVVVYHFSAF